MNEKTPKGFTTSIYVTDREAFEEYKRLLKLQGKSLSEEIMDFVHRRLDELRGTVNPSASDEETARKYKDLKKTHTSQEDEFKKMVEKLHKDPEYQGASELWGDLGLLKDLSNLAEIIPKFIAAWKKTHVDLGFMHEYVSLLELALEKKQVEQKLDELRPAANVGRESKDLATTPVVPQQDKENSLSNEEEPHEEEDDEE